MVNLSVPQQGRNPMVNSSVLIQQEQRRPLSHNLPRNLGCFGWKVLHDNQESEIVPGRLPNIITNHDFLVGTLEHWNCLRDAKGYVIMEKLAYPKSRRETFAHVAILYKWQGLEQEINVSPDVTYELSARVGVLGLYPGNTAEIQATLVLETKGSSDHLLDEGFARVVATSNAWTNLEGNFRLDVKYHRVRLCLEVLDPGVDLIVSCVELRPSHDPPS